MNDIYSLHKKIIIITGGAGLLAEQHALAVLEKLGTPILIDINKKKLKDLENRFKNKGYKIHTFVGDVTNFRKMSIIKTLKAIRIIRL